METQKPVFVISNLKFFPDLKLKVVLADGHVFEDWHEGVIQFAPTYKYFPKSDLYYECNEGRKAGKKIRTPAW